MREKTICFTGHRKIPLEKKDEITRQLKETLIQLINRGYLYFGAGGALGFDTMAEQAVLSLKEEYPQIKLILVLPCKSQANAWSTEDKEVYMEIIRKADKVVYTSQEYFRGCMQKRNRHLVDYSSVCVCYLTQDTGGSAYTVRYAISKGLSIENVAEK
ncbi:MAG: DUF1273 family protein [Ruminococcus sp.]|nr:DUF1273 family protein [Ruminococcus sp.]